MTFKKVFPSLLVALPLLTVAAFSQSNGGFAAQIASAGYGGQEQFCMNIGSMRISPSSRTVQGGSSIDFNGRDFGIEEDVIVTRNGTPVARAHADGGGNFTTGSLSMPTAAGTYEFTFIGQKCNTPITSTITVTPSGTSGGGTEGGGTGGQTGGGESATLTPSSRTVAPGSSIDFNGRNFARETDVVVNRNGVPAGRAHADGGGNFTTGSISLPTEPGTYTFLFDPEVGPSLTSVITVQ